MLLKQFLGIFLLLLIAQRMGIPETVMQEVKQHFWVRSHLVNVDGQLQFGRFTREPADIALWKAARDEGLVNGYRYFDNDVGEMIIKDAQTA